MEFFTYLLTYLIDKIVIIQVIINLDRQKFKTVFISYGAASDLNFQVLLRPHDKITLFLHSYSKFSDVFTPPKYYIFMS